MDVAFAEVNRFEGFTVGKNMSLSGIRLGILLVHLLLDAAKSLTLGPICKFSDLQKVACKALMS